MANSASSGISNVVAKHYNEQANIGLKERTDSRILYLRNFNNWIKSMLIGETAQRVHRMRDNLVVLDVGCGKGGDLLKWDKADVSHMICADIAETSIQQCQERYCDLERRAQYAKYQSRQRKFTMEAIVADCTKEFLRSKYRNPDILIDIVSCQFAFHYCFESLPQAECMLQNVSERLRVGGLFVGTTVDADELMRRRIHYNNASFGNSVYRVDMINDQEKPSLYGAQYNFHLEGVVDCPEFLVYFPTLEKLAKRFGLKLVYKKRFDEFFEEHRRTERGRQLLGKIQALETYPPFPDAELTGSKYTDYPVAEEFVEREKEERAADTREGRFRDRRLVRVGTLSEPEWEVITLYLVFLFEKVDQTKDDILKQGTSTAEHETVSKSNRKRKLDSDGESSNKVSRLDKNEEVEESTEVREEEYVHASVEQRDELTVVNTNTSRKCKHDPSEEFPEKVSRPDMPEDTKQTVELDEKQQSTGE